MVANAGWLTWLVREDPDRQLVAVHWKSLFYRVCTLHLSFSRNVREELNTH